jgi:plastocyanin domain-containing protein
MTKLFALVLPLALCASAVADPKSARIAIHITEKGFEPASITVAAKAPVTLVFQRDTDATCTKSVVIKLEDGKRIERELPLKKPVEIAVTFSKAGKLGYACSMNMNKGTIVVQ